MGSVAERVSARLAAGTEFKGAWRLGGRRSHRVPLLVDQIDFPLYQDWAVSLDDDSWLVRHEGV